MYLAYVDETYTDSVYSFASVLVHDEQDAELQRSVLAIAPRFADHGVPSDAELRGSDLFHSRRGWSALRNQPGLRVHAYRLGLKVTVSEGCGVILVSTLRTGAAGEDLSVARAQAVEALLPCLEREAKRLGERCLPIFDTSGSTDQALVEAIHAHHRGELLAGSSPRLVETPGIAHSHQTPGIQIADLAAFLSSDGDGAEIARTAQRGRHSSRSGRSSSLASFAG